MHGPAKNLWAGVRVPANLRPYFPSPLSCSKRFKAIKKNFSDTGVLEAIVQVSH